MFRSLLGAAGALLVFAAPAMALPTGSVDSREIRDNTIRSRDVRTNTLTGGDIASNTVRGFDILESSLGQVPSAAAANQADNAVNANNSNLLDGRNSTDFNTAGATAQNAAVIASLGAAFQTVVSTTVTTDNPGFVLANGQAELFTPNSNTSGQCVILIDGASSIGYETDFDDIGLPNQATVPVSHGRVLGAGAHTVALQCRAVTGTVGKDDAGVNVVAVG